ncbi:hypothetical protein WA026_015132 [Henosepilachna vigintioctopunctata]|uniref:Uncharacterized protein n=1 Tax=Henosepilachna vigintioctopunctata TaxID=420089 RepID=A0AAW1TNL6_9CUCU
MFGKTSPNWSFNSTRMFIFTLRALTSFHKMDDFKQSLSSSAGVDLGITGSVWRTCPANKIIAPPNQFWFSRKSYNMRSNEYKDFCVPSCTHPKLLVCSTATIWPSQNFSKGCKLVFYYYLHVQRQLEFGMIYFTDIQQRSCNTFCDRIVAKINDIKNVFPVPPGAYKKKKSASSIVHYFH